jgi:radical SAM protein with 4Fe4S-binding SPASM domain
MSITESFDFLIQWHLTEKCNLRCKHCYQSGVPRDELTLSEIKDVVSEISNTFKEWSGLYDVSFSPSFNVTGGEPFLFKNFYKTLEYISQEGFDIYVLSNGTLIEKEKAGILGRLGVKGVQVSMEGPEEIHNNIRGRGSFEAAVNGIRCLLETGLEVTINTTLSNINAGSFHDMVKLALQLRVQRLGFSRLVPSGRGKELLNNMLMKDEVKNIYEIILSESHSGLNIVTGDPLATQMTSSRQPRNQTDSEERTPLGGCAAGVSGITILSDGTFVPCRRLNIPVGNIRQDSLREIWATSPVLLMLRDKRKYKGSCCNCDRWSSCRGCRAIAYAYSQFLGEDDFLAEDPQCFIK